MSDLDVGICALCGQELLRTAADCWHPWSVPLACPPEPSGSLATNMDEWEAWYAAGNRTGRPGREHFREAT